MMAEIATKSLSYLTRYLFLLTSWLIVGFGQPAWSDLASFFASFCGYAIFFRILLDYLKLRDKFLLATLWFAAVQMVQLSWLVSHPYFYIYLAYTLLALAMGVQFGLIGMLITTKRLLSFSSILAMAALWTLLEWSRLYFFSGFSFNPAGLALTNNIYSMQFASVFGVYGLSFWVMLTNLLLLSLFLQPIKKFVGIAWIIVASLPYVYGLSQIGMHVNALENHPQQLKALLLQTSFPVENASNNDQRSTVTYVIDQWDQILSAVQPHIKKPIDLVLLPEYVVLCGTYTCVFPLEKIKKIFATHFGESSSAAFPPLNDYFARPFFGNGEMAFYVNNAFISQALANYLKAGVVIGMEDAEDFDEGRKHYSSAQFFKPDSEVLPERYDKRILLPLGEYIPFDWCRSLAARYGVSGSFTPGESAKVFEVANVPFGVSICYEEMFGDLMIESRLLGAKLLLNLTSDAWYPNSKLARQHFDHARLRTVESGIPLLRSSNIGITGAVDSLGRVIQIEDNDGENRGIYVSVPTYTYETIYTKFGDRLILAICCCLLFLFLPFKKHS